MSKNKTETIVTATEEVATTETKLDLTKLTFEELRALTTEKPLKVVTTATADALAKKPVKQVLLDIVVPFEVPKSDIYRSESHGEAGTFLIPCAVTEIHYQVTDYLSKARLSFNDHTKGISIDLFGFDIERDGENEIIGDPVLNPETGLPLHNEDGTPKLSPRLITQDAKGNPLPAKQLMTFHPQWGIDNTKRKHSRVISQDMLSLQAKDGVPTRTVIPSATDSAGNPRETRVRSYEVIAWNFLPSLQSAIERPMIHLGTPEMDLFVSLIEIAPNAPSKQKEKETAAQSQGMSSPIAGPNSPVGLLPNDAFAPPPEEEATTEAPTETTTETVTK